MIKLIATDMDGTLLHPDGVLPADTYDVIKSLSQKGIRVAVCSGRQYGNLKRLFAPVAEQMAFICENGAYCVVDGKLAGVHPMADADAREAIADFERLGLNVLVSGMETCYVLDQDRTFSDDIIYRLRNTTTIVSSFDQVQEPILKVSGKCNGGIEPFAPVLLAKWKDRLTATVSGSEWFDLNDASKGTGIRSLMQHLSVSPKETAAYGDNFNDEPMLDSVGHPYIMSHAHPALHKTGYTLCTNVVSDWKTLLKNLE